jgi:hypothetical protein
MIISQSLFFYYITMNTSAVSWLRDYLSAMDIVDFGGTLARCPGHDYTMPIPFSEYRRHVRLVLGRFVVCVAFVPLPSSIMPAFRRNWWSPMAGDIVLSPKPSSMLCFRRKMSDILMPPPLCPPPCVA